MLALVGSVLLVLCGCRTWNLSEISIEESVREDLSATSQAAIPSPLATPDPRPAVKAPQVQSAERLLAAKVLQDDGGIRPTEVDSRGWYYDHSLPGYLPLGQGVYRWRHRALEQLLENPTSAKELLIAGLQSSDTTTQAAAWVGLVRLSEPAPAEKFAFLLEQEDLPLSAKAALIEASVAVGSPTFRQQLYEVLLHLESTNNRTATDDIAVAYQRTVWAAMAMQEDSNLSREQWERRFNEAEEEQKGDILDALLISQARILPAAAKQHLRNLSPEAMRRVGIWEAYLRSAAPLSVLEDQLRSPDMATRRNAVVGLGREGSSTARNLLTEINEEDSTLIQVAKVVAWSMLPNGPPWESLAAAESWRVRQAVALWMPDSVDNRQLLRKLADDPIPQVRQIATRRVKEKQPSELNQEPPQTAKVEDARPNFAATPGGEISVEQSMQVLNWLENAEHAPSPAERALAQAKLRDNDRLLRAVINQAAEPLGRYDSPFLFGVLIADFDEPYRLLSDIEGLPETVSDKALSQLRDYAQSDRLPEICLWRLAYWAPKMNTAQWQTLMQIVTNDHRPAAGEIVRLALTRSDYQTQIAACDYCYRFPSPAFGEALSELLTSNYAAVQAAAIRALDRSEAPQLTLKLADYLGHLSVEVQVAAATSIARSGDPRGVDHLRRLTYSRTLRNRLDAVAAVVELNDSALSPLLIRLLNEETAIRRASVDALAAIIPKEDWPKGLDDADSLDAQCAVWKQWAHTRTGD